MFETQLKRLAFLKAHEDKFHALLKSKDSLKYSEINKFVPPYFKKNIYKPKFTLYLSKTSPPVKFLFGREKNNENIFAKLPWNSSLENAVTVVQEAYKYTNVFDILHNNFFYGKFNLHKTKESLLNQNPSIEQEFLEDFSFVDSPFSEANLSQEEFFATLEVSKWPVELFFVSALCYVLEKLYENSEDQTCSITSASFQDAFIDHFHRDLSRLLLNLGPYYFSHLYSDLVFLFLDETKLFLYNPFAAQICFQNLLQSLCIGTFSVEDYISYKIGLVKYLKAFGFTFFESEIFFQNLLEDKTTGISNGDLSKFFRDEFFPLNSFYLEFLKVCKAWKKKSEELPNKNEAIQSGFESEKKIDREAEEKQLRNTIIRLLPVPVDVAANKKNPKKKINVLPIDEVNSFKSLPIFEQKEPTRLAKLVSRIFYSMSGITFAVISFGYPYTVRSRAFSGLTETTTTFT